jgi:tRNA pseudouridine55 synthase
MTRSAGFILIDKPQGWTSHDVVAKVRSRIGGKVGHAGTLDPMATGLLVLGVGGATRLLRFVQGEQKEYITTAQFGVATDSLDAEGSIVSREPLPVSSEEVEAVMQRFTGDILQVPPMVSARKVEGRRLYELAREGKVVEREARPVTIYALELIDLAPSDYPEVTFRVICSTGTYIRTLGDDLARALGGRAHLTVLRRVRNGEIHVDDAVRVEAVVEAAVAGELDRLIVDPARVLGAYRELRVDEATAFRVKNGRELPLQMSLENLREGDVLRIGDRDGKLLAMYRRKNGALMPEVVLE